MSLALQGGGAFGAFTWGVLDRLLEADEPVFDAVSGASAGAVNAVLLANGLRRGGRAEARALLDQFWTRLAASSRRGILGSSIPSGLAIDMSSRMVSPYLFNPLNLSPLRALLTECVDFAALADASPVRLLISATRVSDGSLRLFTEREISADVVMASACLPLLNHAVTIDGESYWDGGYAANPPLMQLVEITETPDILLVQIVPSAGAERPTSSPNIVKRLNQITFNSPLLHEIETLAAMTRLAGDEDGTSALARKLGNLRLEHLSAEDWVRGLAERSGSDLSLTFLTELKESGRAAAAGWLDTKKAAEAAAFQTRAQ